MSHDAPHSDPGHGDGVGHIVSPKILIATAVALLALTGMTVTAAKVSFEEIAMPELTIIVALGIALLKATLVCLFFMHLRWDRSFNGFILVAAMGLVVLFITFAMTDSGQYQPDILQDEDAVITAELAKLPPPLASEALQEHAPQPAAGH